MEIANREDSATSEATFVGVDRKLSQTARRIHPIVIYPFTHPKSTDHLRALYEVLAKLCTSDARFLRPLTVLNRQTVDRVCPPKMSPAQKREVKQLFENFLSKEIEP
jgi:hypothetical protein